MTKEQQDLAWACLPKETRKEIVEIYAYHARSGSCPLTNNFELIFGKHNLTSNTEPEEMLMVKRSDVQALYITAQDEYSSGEPCTIDHSQGMILALRNLFNDKCLPDKELEHRLEQLSVQVESYTKP